NQFAIFPINLLAGLVHLSILENEQGRGRYGSSGKRPTGLTSSGFSAGRHRTPAGRGDRPGPVIQPTAATAALHVGALPVEAERPPERGAAMSQAMSVKTGFAGENSTATRWPDAVGSVRKTS